MKTIVEIAKSYIGQKEIKGNQGFEDKEFEKRMQAVGFVKGWAWCCLFAELCYVSAMVDKKEELTKLFSASVARTQNNFDGSKNWKLVSTPVPGALAVFRTYRNNKRQWQGHIGIVEKVNKRDKTFTCIEGNTNANGGREGIEVARRVRRDNSKSTRGLVLQGFIVPEKSKNEK